MNLHLSVAAATVSGKRSVLSALLVGALLMAGCAPAAKPEPELDQVLGVRIELPMPEDEFLELMSAHSVMVERRGPNSLTLQTLPTSLHGANLEALDVHHAYSVYAGFDAPQGRNQQYMAFVNSAGEVVLIERQFAYVAP
jgi:hypothetical protein